MNNKIIVAVLAILALLAAFGAKKFKEIKQSFDAIKFSVETVKNLNIGLMRTTFKLDLLVRNPLNQGFNLVITEIALLNPSGSVMAFTPTTGLTVSLPSNQEARINDIDITLDNVVILRSLSTITTTGFRAFLNQCKIRINANVGGQALPTQIINLNSNN
jgi:hypothetical protein